MKIRTFPEDFLVEEYLDLDIKPDGQFMLFTFKKKGWSTFDFISSLSTRLKIPRNEINIAGIKDRHAITTSYLTLKKNYGLQLLNFIEGNEKKFIPDVNINFIGFIDKQIKSENIKYNKFSIIVRSIAKEEIPFILERYDLIKKQGIPNYYDDQRFGSARHGKGFVAKQIIQSNLEEAAKLLFITSKYDRKAVKSAKNDVLNFLFNNNESTEKIEFDRVIKNLPSELKNFFKIIYNYKKDYLKAFVSMDRRYLLLLFHAYQSYLYNQLLSELIKRLANNSSYYRIKGEVNDYIYPINIDNNILNFLHCLELPVPSSKLKYDSIADFIKSNKDDYDKKSDYENIKKIFCNLIFTILKEIEEKENIKLKNIDGKLVKINLNNISRKPYIMPENLILFEFDDDDFFKGKKKVKLEFMLEKGSYATILIKAIFLQGKHGKADKMLL